MRNIGRVPKNADAPESVCASQCTRYNEVIRLEYVSKEMGTLQSDILVLEYGNLMRFGGLGYGKGIKAWVKTKSGGKRYFDVGENFYGKEAFAHARKVLEGK